jgi:hypothetical protein
MMKLSFLAFSSEPADYARLDKKIINPMLLAGVRFCRVSYQV